MEFYRFRGTITYTLANATLLLLFCLPSMKLMAQSAITDFPVYEYKSGSNNKTLFIYLSGDGGMNDFSKSLCSKLMEKGYSVMALDSKKYFWKPKDPQQFAEDLTQMIQHYQNLWHSDSLVIIGYSFGADVGAFVPQRLPFSILEKLKLVVFLNPSISTDYEIKLMDMLGKNSDNRKYDIVAEINHIDTARVICLMSAEEETIHAGMIQNKLILTRTLPGDHRFNNNYELIIRNIVEQLL